MTLSQTADFERWLASLAGMDRARVLSRFDQASLGHWGDFRYLKGGLIELKWRSGLRVYFSRRGALGLVALWGGFKSTQDGDILKARRLLRELR